MIRREIGVLNKKFRHVKNTVKSFENMGKHENAISRYFAKKADEGLVCCAYHKQCGYKWQILID